ncbi:hypothetical protein [Trinickia symbiotica]|uniref:hypothetical protein n=1 Tax=Trinickia symbiotica TaxID=863227 RepID=UPI000381422B|nr:hypothetical protein [Trinickia symbiotica]
MNATRQEYERQTDVLETIVASVPVTKNHTDLLTAFATRTDYRGARHVKTRDEFGARPARILDADDCEIAPDYYAWIEAELAAHGGSARAVWEAHKDAGYRLTEVLPLLHYFVQDRGGAQDNFVQLEVWEEQEFVERELFPRHEHWGLPNVDELRRGSTAMLVERVERRTLGTPQYRLEAVIDMQSFFAIAEATYDTHRRADGDRRFIERNRETGEERIVTVRELTPGYDALRWPGRRFIDDWSASSAGRAGERVCLRWTFKTADHTDRKGVRTMDVVPQWGHTRKIAALKNTGKLDVYSLYGKLTQLDERVGHPFAWYFYGLHGNLVKSGQMERVLEAAEDGLIVLPEHDYQVLRAWHAAPYGF